jgi:two-component system chemotaxis response regulator CheB
MSYDLIVIGSSLGGLAATRAILTTISEDLQLPIILIQHREQRAESSMDNLLRNMLRRFTRRKIEEVEDKVKLERGCIYLAPADYHLLVEKDYLCLSADDPEAFARPSIDIAFDSAARNYCQGVIAVVLTGASADGADGAAAIEKRGGLVIVQDPGTAENGTMPQAALAKLERAKILPLGEIGLYLNSIAGDHGGAHSASRLAR